ncbi:hypothetical protein HRG_013354 [Hirsutella rhossiliensis]
MVSRLHGLLSRLVFQQDLPDPVGLKVLRINVLKFAFLSHFNYCGLMSNLQSRSSYAAPTTCLKVNFSKCSASYSQQLKRDSLMVVGTPIVFSHDAGCLQPAPSATQRLQTCHHYAMEALAVAYAPHIILRCANHSTARSMTDPLEASYSQQLKRDVSKLKRGCVSH